VYSEWQVSKKESVTPFFWSNGVRVKRGKRVDIMDPGKYFFLVFFFFFFFFFRFSPLGVGRPFYSLLECK